MKKAALASFLLYLATPGYAKKKQAIHHEHIQDYD